MEPQRCSWTGGNQHLIKYHDEEWGVRLYDDQKLFEFLVLDAFQAGLSWLTVLKKRDNFRKAFDNFDARKIVEYTEAKIGELMEDNGIIRNRLKIEATIANARAFIEVQEKLGSFGSYIWQFVENRTIVNTYKHWKEIPANSPESDAMSRDLKRKGFKFVGTTICYAFMQAAGMVNDHEITCFRYHEV